MEQLCVFSFTTFFQKFFNVTFYVNNLLSDEPDRSYCIIYFILCGFTTCDKDHSRGGGGGVSQNPAKVVKFQTIKGDPEGMGVCKRPVLGLWQSAGQTDKKHKLSSNIMCGLN